MNADTKTEHPDLVVSDEQEQSDRSVLLGAAIIAVDDLLKHLAKTDRPNMYKANRAIHILWSIPE